MKKLSSLVPALACMVAAFSQTEPEVVWQQHFGTPPVDQRVNMIAVDDADNLFVVGYIFSDETHSNLMVNKYDAQGKLLWNDIYSNPVPNKNADFSSIFFTDNQGGITVLGSMHSAFHGRKRGHIVHYDHYGHIDRDCFFGDTLSGTTLITTNVISHNRSYILGPLSGRHALYKIDSVGDILWSSPIYSNPLNYRQESVQIDKAGEVVVCALDSALPKVTVRRYDANTGAVLLSFQAAIDARPKDKMVKMSIDKNRYIFLATIATDSAGLQQLCIQKFDSSGNALGRRLYPNSRGYLKDITNINLGKKEQLQVSANYTDNDGKVKFSVVHKIDNASGDILYNAVDSGELVNDGLFRTDDRGNVFLETTKAETPGNAGAARHKGTGTKGAADSAATEEYLYMDGTRTKGLPELSISKFSVVNGKLLWNKSFENENNIRDLRMHLNKAGDLFFACSSVTGKSGKWFMGRLRNPKAPAPAVNNVAGISDTLNEAENELSIYPNPFNGPCNVAFTTTQTGSAWLKVFDMAGQQLYAKEVILETGKNLYRFNEHFAAGVYIFKLETAQGNFAQQALVY